MEYRCKCFFVLLSFFTCITLPKQAPIINKKNNVIKVSKNVYKKSDNNTIELLGKNLTVRVLLNEVHNYSEKVTLSSEKGFILRSPQEPRKTHYIRGSNLEIKKQGQAIFLNGTKLKHDQLLIKPSVGYTSFRGKTYAGFFNIVRKGNSLMLINCLSIESYVYSVLRTESWPGWPLEVNKVFAITSRTYVIFMMLQAHKSNRSYHVKDTNHHQTYSGVHDCSIIKNAVEQTKGLCIVYNKKPILAMFDSCCGGVIPAHIANFNFFDVPYLSRKYPCLHCKRCRIYSWQAIYDASVFEKQIYKILRTTKRLHDVKIAKRDKAGLVKQVLLKGSGYSTNISSQQFYSLFKEVKSFCFTVRKQSNKVIINGRGFGHHLGLCQWGAREMVRDGWNHKRILKFYYPGTSIMKL